MDRLDGTHTQTIQRVITELNTLIRSSMRTYLPGPVEIQLYLNSVVILILQYRLQFGSIGKSYHEEIEVKLRVAAWRYCKQFSSALNDSTLYDKTMGLQFFSFKCVQDQRQITNVFLHLRDNTQLGEITRAVSKYIFHTFLAPLKIFYTVL